VRKLWYAGAVVAGGIFLLGAAGPAQADLLPGSGTAEQQADEQLASLLGQSNGVNVDNPLQYSTLGTTPVGSTPLMQFKAGNNTPDLNPVLPGKTATAESKADGKSDLPAADVVGGTLRQHGNNVALSRFDMQPPPLQNSSVPNLLGGGLPLIGGLLPSGGTPSLLQQQPTARQAEAFDGGLPLLGGLGGLLPVNHMPKTGDGPDTTGMPAGGMAVLPAATAPSFAADQTPAAAPSAGASAPAVAAPAASTGASAPASADSDQPSTDAAPDDPRLHEEPVDGESGTPRRAFSPDGRPVAGVDQQYK
jgi:hypothetical protein